jgi:D-glycero-D-manno-heptose 1,7-bisphosphate phosphatase
MNITYYNQLANSEYRGLVLLDRDGTLIRNVKGLSKTSEIEWLPERIETLRILAKNNYILAIATNQGAIEEGIVSEHQVLALHKYMVEFLENESIPIWAIAFCPHSKLKTGKTCGCRKPKAGLIDALVKNTKKSLKTIYFIGDQSTDIEAASASIYEIHGILSPAHGFKENLIKRGVTE